MEMSRQEDYANTGIDHPRLGPGQKVEVDLDGMTKAVKEALRDNDGKVKYSLVPTRALMAIKRVFHMGAEKYSERNWEKGLPLCNYVDSMQRHVDAWMMGEDFDEESGEHHMAHVAVNAIMLMVNQKEYADLDDRVEKGKEQINAPNR